MSKKVFTVLLLAVFVLAQFSIASAAPVAGAAPVAQQQQSKPRRTRMLTGRTDYAPSKRSSAVPM